MNNSTQDFQTLQNTLSSLIASDIHFTPQWFELLARTALPEGTKVGIYSLGKTDDLLAPRLPCMSFSNQPCVLHSLSNFYTPLFAPIAGDTINKEGIASLIDRLAQDRPIWTMLNFRPLDPDTSFFNSLTKGLKDGGWWVDRYFCFGNWFLQVDEDSFDSYFAKRPSQLRNTVNRARKKLLKLPNYQLHIQTQADELLEPMLADFVTVYNRSWKKPEPFPDFIPELGRLAAREGWLRLGVIRLNDQPIAAQLWLVFGGVASIVKLAYDQEHIRLSAGSVLTAALMQHVTDIDKVREVDYLIGDDPYKRDWMSHRRERYGIIAFNPRTVSGLVSAACHFGGRLFKTIVKRENTTNLQYLNQPSR